MSSFSRTPDEVAPIAGSAVSEVLGQIQNQLFKTRSQRDELDRMLAGMSEDVFGPHERDSVIALLSEYSEECDRLENTLSAKTELYQAHVLLLEDRMACRRAFLGEFDELLSSQRDLARVFVDQHKELERELAQLHDAIMHSD